MSITTNATIARSVFEDGLNGRDPAVFETLVAPDYVNHERADMLVKASGPQDWSDVLARLSAAFPDVAWVVLRTLAQGDDVWVETRMKRHPRGRLLRPRADRAALRRPPSAHAAPAGWAHPRALGGA